MSILTDENYDERKRQRLRRKWTVILAVISLVIGFGAGFVFFPIYWYGTSLIGGRHLQTIIAPQTEHSAELLKHHNLADINFSIRIDGKEVYLSPDLMPFPDHLYRETLVWDKSGSVVVFELMGRRIFAYNAIENRALGKGELSNYQFYPALSDNYFYHLIKDIDEE